jgi:hypothetical protein
MTFLDLIIPNYTDYKNIIVPCVCLTGYPFPPSPDCEYCEGSGRISYGIAEVEVI